MILTAITAGEGRGTTLMFEKFARGVEKELICGRPCDMKTIFDDNDIQLRTTSPSHAVKAILS